ncbi:MULTISPECIES: chloride channel protein [unclassified Oceanispirochaeta]|uniref:chloride channel protein n=1 Tax=unclassified Oceanispirochaeta TaxID=2635722 RepID=UPI000E099C0E|nr:MULTISPECIES: chloride channel protein [unclassified Oceanispirochaeta]MBF9018212.1 chloride channel protein [Oceanispirochaeta sp. M2]NPD74682.1 chloride channel protein [Oceanispirochaeta sp. M1]RDG29475.1 chloride channel protein [Oceanispirochaeta sp. M1]
MTTFIASIFKKNSSFYNLMLWSLIAIVSAVVANVTVQGFLFLYHRITAALASVHAIPLWVWPIIGAVPVGFFVYSIVPSSMGEGIPSYLEGVRKRGGILSLRETVFKFMAALITLGTYGNGGFLGPVGRMSAGFMSFIGRVAGRIGGRRTIDPALQLLFPICGMAAAVGALMHSPIGAGIFAVEIILKTNMRYRQLFPAILASSVSVYIAKYFGFDPILVIRANQVHMEIILLLEILIVTVSAGFSGKAFILTYTGVSKLFQRDTILSPLKQTSFLIAGSAVSSLLIIANPYLLGKGFQITDALMIFNPDILRGFLPPGLPMFGVLFILILIKGLGNIFTVGSGMSAGFTGPAVMMGMLLGACFADLFHIIPGSPEYFALLAAGFAGYFASIMNTPIAAAIIVVELFGLYYSLPAGLAAVVGYMVNQNHTLYDMALEEREEKLEDQPIMP